MTAPDTYIVIDKHLTVPVSDMDIRFVKDGNILKEDLGIAESFRHDEKFTSFEVGLGRVERFQTER